jgi:CDP-diacylglycerol--serine O-phosphatidyltransferase
VARATNTSDFGMQLDSIADVMNFGCAPAAAVLLGLCATGRRASHAAAPGRHGQLLLCCLRRLRLARFNVNVGRTDPRYFRRHADHGRCGLRGVGGGWPEPPPVTVLHGG